MKKYIFLALFSLLITIPTVYAQEITFSNDLQIGSQNNDVVALQTWLINQGYDIPSVSSGKIAKGYFGQQTRMALSSYQKSVGLPSFGFFGKMTREKLNKNTKISTLTVTSPNGGEKWQKGTYQTITWNAPQYFKATTVDIKLIQYYQPCTGQICPMVGQMPIRPYEIAKNINVDKHAYIWNVGNFPPTVDPVDGMGVGILLPNGDGQYTIQICESGTSNCTSSKKPFTITNENKSSPTINGLDAPTTLTVGQTGTWTVRASDPQNGQLSYNVSWGDENGVDSSGTVIMPSPPYFTQSSTFTHSYSRAGTFTIIFTVKNISGLSAQTKTTVVVTNPSSSSVKILYPNGGEKWNAGNTYTISFNSTIRPVTFYIEGYSTNNINNLSSMIGTVTQPDVTTLNFVIPKDTWYGDKFKIKICAEDCKLSHSSDSYFTIIPERKPTISVTLLNSFEDKAGKGSSFQPGWSSIHNPNFTNADWNFEMVLDLPSAKTIEYIHLQHDPVSASTERWSTNIERVGSASWKDYPLVIFENGKQLNTDFDQKIYLEPGIHNLKLYAQVEKNKFSGGHIMLGFNDTWLKTNIPASAYTPPLGDCKPIPVPEVPLPVLSTIEGAQPSINLITPNGGETFQLGKIYRIVWNSTNVDKATLRYSFPPYGNSGHVSSDDIAFLIPNQGYYDWPVKVTPFVDKRVIITVAGYNTGAGISTGHPQSIDYSDDYVSLKECANDINL